MTELVEVRVPGEEAEVAAGELWRLGAGAVEERHEGSQVVLVAGFEPGATAGAAAALGGRWAVRRVRVVGDDYLDAWRTWARPTRAGALVVRPPWVPAPELTPGDVLVDIDPGRAFGSGGHPSTRLALEALDAELRGGEHVLDVGCGSGVLAVAAVRLGASRAVAVDTDPAAREATAANAARNGVAHRVEVAGASLDAVDARFDVVVANLDAPTLAGLAAPLRARLEPDGALVLAGLLADRWRATAARFAPLRPAEALTAEGWAAVLLRR